MPPADSSNPAYPGVLNRDAIAALIAGSGAAPPLLAGYCDLARQLQPNGFDLNSVKSLPVFPVGYPRPPWSTKPARPSRHASSRPDRSSPAVSRAGAGSCPMRGVFV